MKAPYSIAMTILIIFSTACGTVSTGVESNLTIRVSGTPGTPFRGNYLIPGSGGLVKRVPVEGVVPATYTGRGVTAMCLFRKRGTPGIVKVEILKGEVLVEKAETAEPLGVVTLGKIPDRQSIINGVMGTILDALKI